MFNKKQCLMCQIEFSPVSLKQSGSRFYIEADMLVSCNSVGDDASHMFVPILSDGEHRLELPSVLVAGKKRYRSFRASMWGLGRNLLQGYKIRKIIKAVNHKLISYSYKVDLDYEQWMEKACISFSKAV